MRAAHLVELHFKKGARIQSWNIQYSHRRSGSDFAVDGNVESVARNTGVRSVMALPTTSLSAYANVQIIGCKDERIDADEELDRREAEIDALYQIRLARRRDQEEREEKRRLRREARERGDHAALKEMRQQIGNLKGVAETFQSSDLELTPAPFDEGSSRSEHHHQIQGDISDLDGSFRRALLHSMGAGATRFVLSEDCYFVSTVDGTHKGAVSTHDGRPQNTVQDLQARERTREGVYQEEQVVMSDDMQLVPKYGRLATTRSSHAQRLNSPPLFRSPRSVPRPQPISFALDNVPSYQSAQNALRFVASNREAASRLKSFPTPSPSTKRTGSSWRSFFNRLLLGLQDSKTSLPDPDLDENGSSLAENFHQRMSIFEDGGPGKHLSSKQGIKTGRFSYLMADEAKE
jgi:hypothetical protein